jgi:hypothetical protein
LSRDERTATGVAAFIFGAPGELDLIPAWLHKSERLDEIVLMLIANGLIARWPAQIGQNGTSG